MPINVKNGVMVYQRVYNNFTPDPEKDAKGNAKDVKAIYEYKELSNDEIETAINGGMNHFKLSNYTRTPAEQRRCADLSAKAQEAIALDIAKRKIAANEAEQRQSGSGARVTSLLRFDDSNEAKQHNQRVREAVDSENPDELNRLRFETLKKLNKEMNVQTAADLARVFAVDDETLVNNFEKYNRYAQILGEMETLKNSKALTQEEHEYLAPFKTLGVQMLAVLGARADLIANPYFALLDTDRLTVKNPSFSKISGKMDDMQEKNGVDFGERDSGSGHALGNFFNSLDTYVRNAGSSNFDCLMATDPSLKDALCNTDKPVDALKFHQPVVLHTTDKKALVLTGHMKPGSTPLTVAQYTKQLSDRATKADRFMFTGSKEFTAMLKKMDELKKAQADKRVSNTTVQGLADQLAQAAVAYFEHKHEQNKKLDIQSIKNSKEDFDDEILLHMGKNQREQERLDIAAEYLKYARAQNDTLLKEITAEIEAAQKKAKNAPKQPTKTDPNNDKEAESKPKEKVAKQKEITQNHTRLNFAQNFAENAGELLKRQVPTQTVKKENGKEETTSLMAQDDFAALCALACGSGKTYYKAEKNAKDDTGKLITDEKGKAMKVVVTVENENPEETMKAMLQAVQKGQSMSSEMQKMVRGAQSVTFHSLNSGNFEALGKALADGVKMNNKLMQEAKGFTAEFCACAQLNAKALSILKNPLYTKLSAAANKYLTTEDLQIAQAGKTLNDMHIDGLRTQSTLFTRCGIQDYGKTLSSNEFKQDLAKVCHMYGIELQLAGGKLKLSAIDPQKYPEQAKTISQGLANDPKLNDFLDSIKSQTLESQIAAIGNPKRMQNLFESVALNAQQSVQQSQPQFQSQLQVEQPQPQQIQQPKKSGLM